VQFKDEIGSYNALKLNKTSLHGFEISVLPSKFILVPIVDNNNNNNNVDNDNEDKNEEKMQLEKKKIDDNKK
jgi:hypothetical protein